jgi:Protein of unknown function (DUF1826)
LLAVDRSEVKETSMHRTPSSLNVPPPLLPSGIVVISPDVSAIGSITNDRVGLVVWQRRLPQILVPEINEFFENAFFEHESVGTPQQAAAILSLATEAAAPALVSDIEQLACAFSKTLAVSLVRIGFEYVSRVTKPRQEPAGTGPRLVCTYAGTETRYEDCQGTIRNVPVGHVVVFKEIPGAEPDGSIRRGLMPATISNSVVLTIDRPKLN